MSDTFENSDIESGENLNIDTISNEDIQVGQTYPIYGMITEFISENPGNVIVKLNFNITAYMNINTEEKVEILRKRAFEPGIFISKILSKTADSFEVDCTTVVYGRSQEQDA